MLAWMIYVSIVTLVLTLAALCAEHALRLRQRMTRWVWIGTIIASLIVPATIASVSIEVPGITGSAAAPAVPLRTLTTVPLPGLRDLVLPLAAISTAHAPATQAAPGVHFSITLDAALERGWLSASAAFLCVLLASGVTLGVRAQRWRRTQLAGVPVYIAAGVGPAVVGLIRPRIVLPPWVLEADAERQALVLAHERAHLEARDPLVLTIALALLVLMPWNLPLWWQLRQLRRAIEVDCDARVLRAGHDVARYGEALIDAGERQLGSVGAVAAMAEHRSFMEERLRIMLRVPGRGWKRSAAALGSLSFCLLALAVQVSPPPDREVADAPAAQHGNYDGYVGAYELGGFVTHISRQGTHLIFKPSRAVPEAEIFPMGGAEFFSKAGSGGGGEYTFRTDAQGRATALITRKDGRMATWHRVEESAVPGLERVVQARLLNQKPLAGSEAAVRRYWASLVAGKTDESDMDADFIRSVREQLAHEMAFAQQAGALQSLRFRGVGFRGQDVYDLIGERDTVTLDVTMSAAGRIVLLDITMGPVRNRAPQPGSEAALRKHWASLMAGEPNYEDLGPMLAAAAHQQRSTLLALARERGAIQTVHFLGAGRSGEDVYDVHFVAGDMMTWHVQMAADGKLESCLLAMGPSS